MSSMKRGRAWAHGPMAWATIGGLAVLLSLSFAPAGAFTGPFTPSGLAAGTGVMPTPPGTAPWECEPHPALGTRGELCAVDGHSPFIDPYSQWPPPTHL